MKIKFEKQNVYKGGSRRNTQYYDERVFFLYKAF